MAARASGFVSWTLVQPEITRLRTATLPPRTIGGVQFEHKVSGIVWTSAHGDKGQSA